MTIAGIAVPGGPAALLNWAMTLSQPAYALLPILSIAWTAPRRDGFGRRLAKAAAVWTIASSIVVPLAYLLLAQGGSDLAYDAYSAVSSAAILAAAVPTLLTLFEMTPWQAVFCSSAGYTIQNIASGVAEFTCLLLRRLGGATGFESGMAAAPQGVKGTWVVSLVVFVVVFAGFYLGFIRRIHARGLGQLEDHRMLAVMLLVILAVIGFDVVNKRLDELGASLEILCVLRFVHGAVCLFVLFVQYEMLSNRALEAEVEVERRMAAERERQYELSRANVEAINVKCHDLRHQIRTLAGGGTAVSPAALDDLAAEIDVYDSLVMTGNEALDTILSEKALVCERQGISFSRMADGTALAMLEPAEIYALFGNALDNAMRAVAELGDAQRRSISLVVRNTGSLTCIHVENYFEGTLSLSGDGLPLSTQAGEGHGFGTRSIRRIVERHGGTATFGSRGDVFTLDAIIPQ